jgi:hypothetical protein
MIMDQLFDHSSREGAICVTQDRCFQKIYGSGDFCLHNIMSVNNPLYFYLHQVRGPSMHLLLE